MISHGIPFGTMLWQNIAAFFRQMRREVLPNGKDNLKQIFKKLLYLAIVLVYLCATVWLCGIWNDRNTQNRIIEDGREIWYRGSGTDSDRFERLSAQNPDLYAWLHIPGTEMDNPVFWNRDPDYYKTRNRLGKQSRYGALSIDGGTENFNLIGERNAVISGNALPDGSMFGMLENYRSLDFFRGHAQMTLTTRDGAESYLFFAAFLVDGNGEDGDLLKLNRTEKDYKKWLHCIYERSFFVTNVTVSENDRLIALVTDAADFDGAKLVCIAREMHSGDEKTDFLAMYNTSAKAWYRKSSAGGK